MNNIRMTQNILFGTLSVVQVTKVKPDVILGLSAVGGLFSKEVSCMLKE
jgi:hypothetical protein